ncbi:NUDIX domain-containing protein [Arsukibacterium sp.]|uniref:NUDIX domain-containing protein n=1 Tax=Arsukibacterium sp. TaxID=1977258 RepID=UPI002FD9A4BC
MSDFKWQQYPSFRAEQVKIIDQSTVFQGFFRIEQLTIQHPLFAGGYSAAFSRELLERGHAAVVLPYNPHTDELVLIEQFRIGALDNSGRSPWLLEAIAGMIEPASTAEATALREAEEEAGIRLDELWPMLSYLSSPGGTTERVQVFLGRLTQPVSPGIFGLTTEHEDIKVHLLKRETAMQLLQQQHIDNAATVIALQWLALHLPQVQAKWGQTQTDLAHRGHSNAVATTDD